MGRLSFGRVLDSLCLSNGSSSCFCTNSLENQDECFETKPLVASEGGHLLRLKDVLAEPQTLAFQLKPKMVVLRVSMHCNGCARKVEKHISKIEGTIDTSIYFFRQIYQLRISIFVCVNHKSTILVLTLIGISASRQ
ncbi:hypothetical protein RHGRI_000739 [Rhododendron griersonianum]|uniref:HMA domain-containing protein n=1 Tax=Rhododendron griersonianum TaxID=479676 RepID=A0AAV6LIW6_9ERIC|nr:hypothetical protein RHGRI_000739 [Rhododendron griersonianum]